MTRSLPPMANIFAALAPDSARAGELQERLAAAELTPWPTPTGWVVGVAPLPHASADPTAVRDAGIVFVEGRDRAVPPDRDVAESLQTIVSTLSSGPEGLVRIGGDFGFLRFDADGVTAVRSCAGTVPLYLHRACDGSVAIATLLDYFPRLLGTQFALDPLATAVFAAGWGLSPDRRTVLRDVSVLPRGCYARVSTRRGTMRIGRYWDPRPTAEARLVVTAEHHRRLREILLAALARELDPGGANLLGLSGGVDSSSLAALAAGTLGLGCATLTLLPRDAAGQRTELGYLDPLCRRYGLGPNHRTALDRDTWLDLIRRPQGTVLQPMHPNLLHLRELVAEHEIRVLFGGEAADQLVGSSFNLTDWYEHTKAWTLVAAGPRAIPFGRRKAAGWIRHRLQRRLGRLDIPYLVQLPRYCRSGLREEYAEWRERRRGAFLEDRRPLRTLALWYEHDSWVAMNWEAASRLGIRRSLPFYTREAQELAFECHPRELIGPGTKKLLRTALAGDVPVTFLQRSDKGAGERPVPGEATLDEPIPPSLSEIVSEEWIERPPEHVDLVDALGVTALTQLDRRLALANNGGA